MNHTDLPPAYLASCREFFKSIKQQAPELRASSIKRRELMIFLSKNYSQKFLKSLSIKDLRRIYKDWQDDLNII